MSVMKKQLEKTYSLKVDRDMYAWLKHRSPKTIREIILNYRDGILVKAVAGVVSSPEKTHVPTVTRLDFSEYPCTARFHHDKKEWCKYSPSRKPREILCLEECISCTTQRFQKKGLIPKDESTGPLPKHGKPLKTVRADYGRRGPDIWNESFDYRR